MGWRDTRTQDGVIASALAFLAQACGGQPRERMEPVHGARQLTTDLQEPVEARDMCQFMRKHDAPAVLRPKRGTRRQYDNGADNPPGERHSERTAALPKADAASEFVDLGKFQDGAHPIFIEEGFRMPGHPGQAC